MKKKVVVVRSNFVDRDPWLLKGIETLINSEYDLTLLYWNRDKIRETHEYKYFKSKSLNLRAPWGYKVLPLLPVWWAYIFFSLIFMKWDIVHVINFDSVIPAIIISKLKKKFLIYEIFDIYTDIIILPTYLRRIGIKIENYFMKISDAVIIANKAQNSALGGISNINTIEIYKTPEDHSSLKNYKLNVFTIFYAGVLYKCRLTNLDKVINAIKDIDDVQLIIAGYGDMVQDIKEWSKDLKGKIKFIGTISYNDVLKHTLTSDLLFALYDPDIPGVKNASCNKLFEAIMASKPIIVSKDTAMAQMVKEEDCGIVVDPYNVSEIKKAILKLKDNPSLARKMGMNGRKAYEEKYNKKIMDKRLLSLYDKLSQEVSIEQS